MKFRTTDSKNILVLLLVSIVLFFTACNNSKIQVESEGDTINTSDIKVFVSSYEIASTLETQEEVVLYTGDVQTTRHLDIPSEGTKYLIIEMEIEVVGEEIFEIENLYVTFDGENISSINGEFLSNHNYMPITNARVISGTQNGAVVFEVPDNIDTNSVNIVYGDIIIRLSELKAESRTGLISDTNIEQIELGEVQEKSQEEIESEILRTVANGDFTIEKPYLIQNPYGKAPLTALALFNTPDEVKIKVRISGRDDLTEVEYIVDNISTMHQIPIVGMYADADNEILIEAIDISGNIVYSNILNISTPKLPDDIYDFEVDTMDFESGEEHFTHVSASNGYNTIIDVNGDVRWYYDDTIHYGFTYLENGHFYVNDNLPVLYGLETKLNQTSILREIDMLGKVYNELELDTRIHHDFKYVEQTGEIYITGHNPYGTGIEDAVYIIDSSSGVIRDVVDYSEVIDRYRVPFDTQLQKDEDWAHQNSVEYVSSDGGILSSLRRQGVIKTNSDNALEWILSPHDGWDDEFAQYLLTPIDETGNELYDLSTLEGRNEANEKFFPLFQHAAYVAPNLDSDEDTLEIILFSNGGETDYTNPEVSLELSEAIVYSINSEEKTVSILRRFGRELGYEFFSHSVSGAVYLENDHMLIASGSLIDDTYMSHIIEVDENNDIIWSLKEPIQDEWLHDVHSVDIYPDNYNFNIMDEKKNSEVTTKTLSNDKYLEYLNFIEYELNIDDISVNLFENDLLIEGILKDIDFEIQLGYIKMYKDEAQFDIYGYTLLTNLEVSQMIELNDSYEYFQIILVDEASKEIYSSDIIQIDKYIVGEVEELAQLPEANVDIEYSVETILIQGDKLYLEGWSFIENMQSEDSEISIVLSSDKSNYIISTMSRIRNDVTESFENEGINYDNSGFLLPEFDLSSLNSGEYTVGITVENGENTAYVMTENFFSLSDISIYPENGGLLEIQADLSSELESIPYTDEITVISNPYEQSPLTALAKFSTQNPTKVSVTIKGKTEEANITHSFESYETEHDVPIYGLYADYNNEVIFTLESEDGTIEEKVINIQTSPLPDDMMSVEVSEADIEEMMPGLTFVSSNSSYTVAVDVNGDIRWYFSDKLLGKTAPIGRTNDNNLLVPTTKVSRQSYYTTGFYEVDLFGRIHAEYAASNLHHDIRQTENGNYIAAVEQYGYTEEDYIIEIDQETGEIVRDWDIKEILGMEDPIPDENYLNYYKPDMIYENDWFHNNGLYYVDEEDSLIVSGRHQDMVFKMDAETQEVKWVISNPDDEFPEELQDKLLTPIGDDFEWQYAQHAPEQLPNGDILIFDNGNFRSKTEEGSIADEDNYSRAVIYRVDEENMTVEQVWQYGEERGYELYTPFMGDVDYLAENHYIFTFGFTATDDPDVKQTYVVEVKNDEVVSQTRLYADISITSYRGSRITPYFENEGYVDLSMVPNYYGESAQTPNVEIELLEVTVFEANITTFEDQGDRIFLEVEIPEAQDEDKVYIVFENDNETLVFATDSLNDVRSRGIQKIGLQDGEYIIGLLIETESGAKSYTVTDYKYNLS